MFLVGTLIRRMLTRPMKRGEPGLHEIPQPLLHELYPGAETRDVILKLLIKEDECCDARRLLRMIRFRLLAADPDLDAPIGRDDGVRVSLSKKGLKYSSFKFWWNV